MRARILKQSKKIEAAQHFNEEVVNHYKSHITKFEKEDLERELSRNIHKQTQLGGGPVTSTCPSVQWPGGRRLSKDRSAGKPDCSF